VPTVKLALNARVTTDLWWENDIGDAVLPNRGACRGRACPDTVQAAVCRRRSVRM